VRKVAWACGRVAVCAFGVRVVFDMLATSIISMGVAFLRSHPHSQPSHTTSHSHTSLQNDSVDTNQQQPRPPQTRARPLPFSCCATMAVRAPSPSDMFNYSTAAPLLPRRGGACGA
jgi:hypothetical protein